METIIDITQSMTLLKLVGLGLVAGCLCTSLCARRNKRGRNPSPFCIRFKDQPICMTNLKIHLQVSVLEERRREYS